MRTITKLILASLLLTVACTSSNQKEQIAQKSAITIDTSSQTQATLSDLKSNKGSSIRNIYKKLQKQPQLFQITTNKETVIICKEGTKLTIPANCFVTVDGKEVTEPVELKTQEFYSKADILLANLSTLSNGKLLESGGMLNIQAFAGNKELKLKRGTSIQVEMPAQERKEDMQLFNGVKDKLGNINWVLAEQVKESFIEKAEMPLAVIIDGYRELIERSITITDSKKRVLINDSYIHADAAELRTTEKCSRYDFLVNVYSNGHIQLVKSLKENNSTRNNIWFIQSKDGNDIKFIETNKIDFAKSLFITLDSSEGIFTKLGFLTLEIAPLAELINNSKSFPIQMNINIELGKDDYGRYIELPEQESNNIADPAVTLNQQFYNNPANYIFTVIKLGYINCDRFYYDRNPKVIVKVNAGVNSNVQLMFKDINSFLSPNNVGAVKQFKNIPANRDITVVAIKEENNSIFLAIKEANTSDKKIELSYEKVTLEQFRARMGRLI